MRLWSIHPKYLDAIGLIAVWREGLLAKKVLENKTKGYKNHPQLVRFKNYKDPIFAINAYLYEIYKEGLGRGYKFNPKKICEVESKEIITVTSEQIKYEFKHLLKKLRKRSRRKYNEIREIKDNEIEVNPIFKIIKGEIEPWEKLKD